MKQDVLTDEGLKIFPQLIEFEGFYLAEGTALALQIGHRVSVDFDLFHSNEISSDLLKKVEKIFSNHQISVSVNSSDELTIWVSNVKLTFLYYPFELCYPLNKEQGLRVASVKEMAAMKAYTIGRRGSFKDYVDLYFLLKEEHITLEEMIDDAKKKYGEVFNSRLFLEQIIYTEDLEEGGIRFLKEKVSKDDMRSFFEKTVASFKV